MPFSWKDKEFSRKAFLVQAKSQVLSNIQGKKKKVNTNLESDEDSYYSSSDEDESQQHSRHARIDADLEVS